MRRIYYACGESDSPLGKLLRSLPAKDPIFMILLTFV